MRSYTLTGNQLKAARREKGINQTDFGRSIGFARCTISYWECKESIEVNQSSLHGALLAICEALGLKTNPTSSAPTRAWGFINSQQTAFDCYVAERMAEFEQRQAERTSKSRVRCGAKTRKGRPCRLMSEPGRRRCKFHGGMSTGPKTAEGKARIAEAQRRRWALFHSNPISE